MLAWLLGESRSDAVRDCLASADQVLTSEVTLIECDRVLIRAGIEGRLSEGEAADRRGTLGRLGDHWTILRIDDEVVERARRPFPSEPVRTLDAIHLASALLARRVVPGTGLLTLDHRIAACARELGFEVAPD